MKQGFGTQLLITKRFVNIAIIKFAFGAGSVSVRLFVKQDQNELKIYLGGDAKFASTSIRDDRQWKS